MKIFLDANVLISVVNKEYPLFSYSSRIISLSDSRHFKVYTSPLCLAIAFYFAEKKSKKTARQKIDTLVNHLSLTSIDESIVKKVSADIYVQDFEDGLQYYSALGSRCDCIITEDIGDFYFSKIEVLNCEAFFDKYLTSGYLR